MSAIKRYDVDVDGYQTPHETGHYVLASDHDAILAEMSANLTIAERQVTEAQEKRDEWQELAKIYSTYELGMESWKESAKDKEVSNAILRAQIAALEGKLARATEVLCAVEAEFLCAADANDFMPDRVAVLLQRIASFTGRGEK